MRLERFTVRSGKTRLYFGIGSISSLRDWLKNFSRVALITGKKSAKISGALDDALSIIKELRLRYEVFSEVFPNPTASMINELATKVWRFGADAVLAIGGGSVIDSAKFVSMLVKCGGRVEEYMKKLREPCGTLPLAAINLTHGTGTEVDRYAVATIEETHEKMGYASEFLYPEISIDDPNYLKTLPKNQTIYTAIDALYHALESATSNSASPYTELLAKEAVRLIAKWLPVAVKEPSNVEARYWLLYASMIAGIGIDHGRTHLAHAIEHALSGLRPELPHGAGLAMIGPYVIKYTYEVKPEVLYDILRYIDPELKPRPESSERAAKALIDFQRTIGFNERLRDYGFKEGDLGVITKLVFESMSYLIELTPFKVDESIIKDIFLKSL